MHDVERLGRLVHVAVGALGAEAVIVGRHHGEAGLQHLRQAEPAVIDVRHRRGRAGPGDAAGAVRPGNHRPAGRRAWPAGTRTTPEVATSAPSGSARMVEDADRRGAGRQGVAGEGLLSQQVAGLGRGQGRRRVVEGGDRQGGGLSPPSPRAPSPAGRARRPGPAPSRASARRPPSAAMRTGATGATGSQDCRLHASSSLPYASSNTNIYSCFEPVAVKSRLSVARRGPALLD